MKLSSLLDPRLVQLDSDAETIDAAVEAAVSAIVALYPEEVNREETLRRLTERRKLGGTCFPSGVAIPHARLPDFKDFIISAVVPKKPILSGEACIDESCKNAPPVRIVWVILLSQTSSSIYLNTLAKLMEASKNEAVMSSLVRAESSHRFVSVVEYVSVAVAIEPSMRAAGRLR